MYDVANYLRKSDPKSSLCSKEDLARSAFSRFYYAAFLVSRNLVAEIDGSWGRIAHVSLPQLMRGSVTKSLNAKIRSAERRDDQDRVRTLRALKSGIKEAARILDEARKIREIADYNDFQSLIDEAGRVKINDCTLEDAMTWKFKCEAALYASRQIKW